MSIKHKDLLIKSLPEYLKKDLDAFIQGEKANSTVLDCLYCELQSSINIAFYANAISEKEADFLRTEYLGMEW